MDVDHSYFCVDVDYDIVASVGHVWTFTLRLRDDVGCVRVWLRYYYVSSDQLRAAALQRSAARDLLASGTNAPRLWRASSPLYNRPLRITAIASTCQTV